MSQSVPVATLERDIREGGHSTATLRAQDVLREFGVFCSMSKGAVLDALMSRENRAYEVYNAIGIEPPDEVIFARNERWSTVGLAA